MARWEFHKMYLKRQGRIFLIPSCIKLWLISPDRLAVINTRYPQIHFNVRSQKHSIHPILVVTKKKKKKKKNLARVNSCCSLPQRLKELLCCRHHHNIRCLICRDQKWTICNKIF